MMRKVSNSGVNAINSLKSKFLYFSRSGGEPQFLSSIINASVPGIFQSTGVLDFYGFWTISVGRDAALECYITKSQGYKVETNSFAIINKELKLLFVFVLGGVGESWDADNLDDEWTRYHSQSQNQGEHQWGNTESK